MNLEKNRAIQSKVCFIETKGKKVKDQEKIMKNFYQFYEKLFSNDVPVSKKSISNYLKDINLGKHFMKQRELCEGELTKNEVKDALNKMQHNKTPNNDGLIEEFFKKIWFKIRFWC